MSVHESRQRLIQNERMSVDPLSPQDDSDAGVYLEDIAVDNDYVMSGTNQKAQSFLDEMARRQKAKQIAIPTDDGRVRMSLRELGEPITLFAEDKADRRERLRNVLLALHEYRGVDVEMRDYGIVMDENLEEEGGEEEEEEEFYTPGDEDLLESRQQIARYSLIKARDRRSQQMKDAAYPLTKLVKQSRILSEYLRSYSLMGMQYASDRAISTVKFSPNSKLLAAGSWTGSIRLMSVPTLEDKSNVAILRGHTDKIGGIAWHPQATISQSPESVNLVSGGGDGSVRLWSLNKSTSLAILAGHEGRVCRVAFHPSGKFVASASFDYTWRFWDIETQRELLMQEGHSKEVYTVAIQNDGALLVSGGLDGIGRIWDLRTGKTIMVLDGHSREIYSSDFSPNGYQVATGSGDATIKIWDIRKVRAAYTIPAHKNIVSDLKFYNGSANIPASVSNTEDDRSAPSLQGSYLVSSSYDGAINVSNSQISFQLVLTIRSLISCNL
ncbi:WD40-repeat-containing domain protein [Dipodascopsis uninucleata]